MRFIVFRKESVLFVVVDRTGESNCKWNIELKSEVKEQTGSQ
jgi:hypothetical protein